MPDQAAEPAVHRAARASPNGSALATSGRGSPPLFGTDPAAVSPIGQAANPAPFRGAAPASRAEASPTRGFATALKQAREAAGTGDHRAALDILHAALPPDADYVEQARAAKTLGAIDLAAIGLRPLRLALVAASTMEHLAPVLRLHLAFAGFNADITVAPFDTTMASVLDPDSALHRFRPDIVWLFATHRDLPLPIAPEAPAIARDTAVADAITARAMLWTTLRERLGCLVIDNLVDPPPHDPFGNFAGAAPWGRRAMLRRYNVALTEAAPPGVIAFDLDHLAALHGAARWNDARYWFHSRHGFALDASGPVAHAAARLIAGARGLARKCLVLDLDNTLWGGVIADDLLAGIRLGSGADGEAFVAFQRYAKSLKDRGVILAACSKNDPDIAAAVFRDHPDTVLRLDDFAAFVANWDNKADNLRTIAARLNIGLDSLVFVDDNPAERDIVRRHLPEVAVVDLPDEPADYIAALAAGRWFETTGFSAEDRARGRLYADNLRREAERAAFIDMDAYLRSLEMVATIGEADPFHLPRMAQLIAKSNQFHLTGTRYGEAELAALAAREGWLVRRVHLADRLGDNGLVAVLLAEAAGGTLRIDTWVMSCRVLGRTLEDFIGNELHRIAHAAGCATIIGRYIPTAKNRLVADLYARLGFSCIHRGEDGTTIWNIATAAPPRQTWIHAAPAEDHAA